MVLHNTDLRFGCNYSAGDLTLWRHVIPVIHRKTARKNYHAIPIAIGSKAKKINDEF